MRKLLVLSALSLLSFTGIQPERTLEVNNQKVKTTYEVEDKFYGTYKGKKEGFLFLKEDGTGTYQYDYKSLSGEGCDSKVEIIWGFIVDENGDVVKFERPYGFSYPIIYNAVGESSFRQCKEKEMIDYILEYKTGKLTVSSSDDWMNQQ